MYNTNQKLMALINSHYRRDDDHFLSVTQCIASEFSSKSSTKYLADNINKLIGRNINNIEIPTQLNGMVNRVNNIDIDDFVITQDIKSKIDNILKEYNKKEILEQHNLPITKRLLFNGPTGTGKTSIAIILSQLLGIPTFYTPIYKIIDSYLGASSANLGKLFEFIKKYKCTYIFDEFEALSQSRRADTKSHDVGEMRRITNSLIQILDDTQSSESIIIATTNFSDIIDTAILRRFDNIWNFDKPNLEIYNKLIDLLCKKHSVDMHNILIEKVPFDENKNHSYYRTEMLELIKKELLK